MYESVLVEVEVTDQQLILLFRYVCPQFLPELFHTYAAIFVLIEAVEG